ncbi:MAG: BCCT family transporter [Paracoccus sp. (in: a-proteobacteria)]|uniref:BCCT family transporter n=1 Tax=Paracoccus sp. TaxID=267 RepID=UPI004058A6F4
MSYRCCLPLTIRTGLASLFGARLEGSSGHVVAIVAVVATVLGAAQTLGYGVEQFVAGVARASGGAWLLNPGGTASTVAIFVAQAVIVSAATMPGVSGSAEASSGSRTSTGVAAFSCCCSS